MRLWAVAANRLALALLEPQQIDDGAAKQKYEDQRGDDRTAGAKRDVAKHVEERDLIGQFGQPVEHWVEP
jgi:hypothetical protein